MTFADMLVYLRKREHLSQRELAEKIGISPSSITMYENGQRYPSREIEETIADIFNVNLSTLRGRTDDSFGFEISLNLEERKLIDTYRKDPEFRSVIQLIKQWRDYPYEKNNDEGDPVENRKNQIPYLQNKKNI